MAKLRLLSIFTTLLGNKPATERLRDCLGRMPDVDPTWVLLGSEDYGRYPAPWWARKVNAWEAIHIARAKAREALDKPFDALFVNGWEYIPAFQEAARTHAAAAVMDAVPATMHQQLVGRGYGGPKREAIHFVHQRTFRAAVRRFDRFLPMSTDCKEALVEQYGVPAEHCRVTLAPQDLRRYTVTPRVRTLPLQLIFVGNDFERKGGPFLLRLFREHLASYCRLRIVSNDPGLAGVAFPDGMQWLRGLNRDQVLEHLAESDLFVFPTRQDFMPQVLGEALAAGVPCVASDVGGVKDLVISGRTGLLMPFHASLEQWAQALAPLREHPEQLDAWSHQARAFAEEQLSMERFEGLVHATIDEIREIAGRKRSR
jgi:glycosyltransferase involved in cell wall biosynthesis